MSQYMCFFLRCGDEFCPIATYSRSTNLYQDFKDTLNVPYEKIMSLSKDNLKDVIVTAEKEIKISEKNIEKHKKEISTISGMNNSVEEKTAMIEEISFYIEENNMDIESRKHEQSFCSFLDDIIDEVVYDNNTSKFKADKYLYVGIEIATPTVDDIIER